MTSAADVCFGGNLLLLCQKLVEYCLIKIIESSGGSFTFGDKGFGGVGGDL